MKRSIYAISLGCPKNLVDTEFILGSALERGFALTVSPEEADFILVNTCAFIREAVEESIDTILECSGWKKGPSDKCLVVCGCLPQRYGPDLSKAMPEIDIMAGVDGFALVPQLMLDYTPGRKIVLPPATPSRADENSGTRLISTQGFAYLKIAEGCSHRCAFCIIPRLRGPYKSRKMETLLSEAKMLARQGVKELILVAQDTASYGIDLYGEKMLHRLLEKLCGISGLEWIRVLYLHPDRLYPELMAPFSENDEICAYMDVPLQHSEPRILRMMHRKPDAARKLLDLRGRYPDLYLRTTLMVGFPGETEKEFENLLDFVQEVEFDQLGVFEFSKEEGAIAAEFSHQIHHSTKKKRRRLVMLKQQEVLEKKNRSLIGTVQKVIIEGEIEQNGQRFLAARTEFQAPDVDGRVLIRGWDLFPGEMAKVKITGLAGYDLLAEVVDREEQKARSA